MKRREILKAPIALAVTQMAIFPNQVQAQFDPVTLPLVLGLISAGGMIFSAKIAADRTAEAQVEVAKMQFALQRMQQEFELKKLGFGVGQVMISEERFFDKRGEAANALLSSNVDNQGTEFGVQGRLASRRGQYGGDFYSVEAARFAKGIERGAAMPVPVESGYHSISPERAEKVAAIIGRDKYAVAGRRYSTARNATSAGWDIETVLYVNSNNTVDAKILPRMA